jgi:hypothetical protein
MSKTRIWRIGTAALAASALLMATVGGATAQSVDDLTDVLDREEASTLADALSGDGESDSSALDGLLDQLGLDTVEDLLDQLGLDSLDDLLGLLQTIAAEDNDLDGPDVQEGEAAEGVVPDAGIGGFIGRAEGTALEIGVGLPAELAEGIEPVLTGLGIRDEQTGGIRITFADTEAELQRVAEGEEITGLAKALHTNLLLDSPEGESPGACTGGDTVELPPDQQTPLLRIGVAGIDCEQDDERAFAHAELSEVTISLAGLIEAGFPEEIRDGIGEAVEGVNESLLNELNANLCNPEEEGNLNDLFDGLFGDDQEACDALALQLTNPFDVDIPLVSVQGLASTSEVNANDTSVDAEARATLTGANVLGMVCIGGDAGADRISSNASAATDGTTGEQSSGLHETEGRHCPATASILRLISDPGTVDSIRLFEAELRDALGGNFEDLFDGIDELFEAINTSVYTQAQPFGHVDGAGAVAGVTPLNIVATAPFSELPGFEETPLGDISVNVSALGVEAAVNAEPAPQPAPAGPDPDPAPEPEEDLPVTGAGAGLLGLAAMAGAVALRRRDDE